MNLKIPILNSVLPKSTQNTQINIEENIPIETSLTNKFSEDLRNNHENLLREFERISKDLISMGYHPRIVTNAFLAFKYKSTEEAIELIDKTAYSLWNHKFIASDNSLCYVCDDKEDSHKSVDLILKRKNTENKNLENSINFDVHAMLRKNTASHLISGNENRNLQKNISKEIINNEIFTNANIIIDINCEGELCPICFFKLEEDKIFNLQCNHKFCKECIDEYLKEEIRNSRVNNIKCPKKNCETEFNEENIKQIIDEEFFYKYKKFLLRVKYKKNPNYVICPIVNCEGYADKNLAENKNNIENIINESEENKDSENRKIFESKEKPRSNLIDQEPKVFIDIGLKE